MWREMSKIAKSWFILGSIVVGAILCVQLSECTPDKLNPAKPKQVTECPSATDEGPAKPIVTTEVTPGQVYTTMPSDDPFDKQRWATVTAVATGSTGIVYVEYVCGTNLHPVHTRWSAPKPRFLDVYPIKKETL